MTRETWNGPADRGLHRKGQGTPFRDPDSFEVDRLELGRDAAQAFAVETLYPAEAVARRLGIREEAEE